MLCPEVWNFKAPASNFKVSKGDPEHADLDAINNLYYNHLVSIILPDAPKVPASLSETLINDCDYYKVSNLTIAELVDSNFINNFVKKGNLTGLSINTRIDCDDCASVTPTKKLILSLKKETYQQLGLEGKASHFAKTTKSKYVVVLDLAAESFQPGKKNYERTANCLKKLQGFTFVFTWEPPEAGVCPSSLAKYFHKLNYNVTQCKPSFETKTSFSVKVPSLEQDVDIDEVVEWIGMVSLDADLEGGKVDGYLNTYETPEPNVAVGQVRRLTWQGLFTPKQIRGLLDELSKFIISEGKEWISIYVQGFSDSPVNWRENEHHFYTHGDNGYVILLQQDQYVMVSNRISNKRYK